MDNEYYDPRMFRATGPTHSGSGRLGESIALFAVLFAIFCLGIYALGMYPDGHILWWCLALVGMLLPWGLVYHLVSSKTNRQHRSNGTELTQL